MAHTLPPRPPSPSLPSSSSTSTLPPHPPPTAAAAARQPAGTSTTCPICTQSPPKYTCPACHTRTCSLPCSQQHKQRTGCSGVRNKAAYVPMNQYGWGTMMDDYVFLEDVGRKVGEWGREIVRGGYVGAGMGTRTGTGVGMDMARGGGKGKGRGGSGKGGGGRTKRDVLKMQLEARDVDVDLLPLGMERRKLNQSIWDTNSNCARLTIEMKLYPLANPLAPSSQAPERPYTILTHKNNADTPLLTLLQSQITSRKASNLPSWLRPLVFPDPEDAVSFAVPHCVIAAPIDPLSAVHRFSYSHQPYMHAKRKGNPVPYYSVDPTLPLIQALKHMHFVEFPTIEVWEEFRGMVVDAHGTVMQSAENDGEEDTWRRPKKRKLNVKAGKKAIKGLLGDYGSGSDGEGVEEDEEQKEVKGDGLALLGMYEGSDDDDAIDGGSDDEGNMVGLIRRTEPEAVGEDAVDWGDESEEDTSP